MCESAEVSDVEYMDQLRCASYVPVFDDELSLQQAVGVEKGKSACPITTLPLL